MLVGAHAANASIWNYEEEADRMSGKKAKYAQTESDNSLNLRFPYQGKNHGVVQVRQHPQYGLDVILIVDKGQILCSQFSSCNVTIRFGDGKPMTFEGSPSADNDSKVVFLKNPRRFINEAKKHKNFAVQLMMYQAGNQVLEFSVPEPLKW